MKEDVELIVIGFFVGLLSIYFCFLALNQRNQPRFEKLYDLPGNVMVQIKRLNRSDDEMQRIQEMRERHVRDNTRLQKQQLENNQRLFDQRIRDLPR